MVNCVLQLVGEGSSLLPPTACAACATSSAGCEGRGWCLPVRQRQASQIVPSLWGKNHLNSFPLFLHQQCVCLLIFPVDCLSCSVALASRWFFKGRKINTGFDFSILTCALMLGPGKAPVTAGAFVGAYFCLLLQQPCGAASQSGA